MSFSLSANGFPFQVILLTATVAGLGTNRVASAQVMGPTSGQLVQSGEKSQPMDDFEADGLGSLEPSTGRLGGKFAGPPSNEVAPPEASLSDGRLHIQGTSGDDMIEVELNGAMIDVIVSRLNVDATTTELLSASFDANVVDEIRMFGLAGDDILYNLTSIPDFIWGGIGNDVIRAGNGVSYVYGQSGVDYCFGGDGDDLVSGGDDQDYVAGEDGSDTVYGGFGIDLVTGGYWGAEQEHDQHVDAIYGGPDPDFFVEPTMEFSADLMVDFDNAEDGIY